MSLKIKNSVKIILLNDENEMLLMCAHETSDSANKKEYTKYWFPIGGTIEEGESVIEAAIREINEETGLKKEEIRLGPVVWKGQLNFIFNNRKIRQNEVYMVVKTKQKNVFLNNLDEWEKKYVSEISWFSYERIKNTKEVIFPVVLPEILPDIIAGKYPEKPIEVDLSKKPKKPYL